jgi:hypothetical protein
MTKKKTPLSRYPFSQTLVLFLSFGYLAGCKAVELEPITYQEAVTQYQEAGGVENYRCSLVPTDEQYQTRSDARPIAVEIDDRLFIKLDGVIHELQQNDIDENFTAYSFKDMSATLTTVSQFNYSEYNESDDRHVDLAFKYAGKNELYRTFGTACGL